MVAQGQLENSQRGRWFWLMLDKKLGTRRGGPQKCLNFREFCKACGYPHRLIKRGGQAAPLSLPGGPPAAAGAWDQAREGAGVYGVAAAKVPLRPETRPVVAPGACQDIPGGRLREFRATTYAVTVATWGWRIGRTGADPAPARCARTGEF